MASIFAAYPKSFKALNDIFDIEVLIMKSIVDKGEENLAARQVGKT